MRRVIPEGTFHLDLSSIGAEPLEAEDPRQIGAFPIRAVLGSGGMGRVYLGVAPEGYAAVKRVLPYLSNDKTFLRHFGQELDNQARLPAGVSARLLAADRTARPPWFATEYIPGVTLHDSVYLNGGTLPIEVAWQLLRELAQRLQAVAALEMVHRDLKPSNVMLTNSGVTLIDFGVARAADQSTVTATGMIVGTPAYMAPEQARAVKTLTPAADVFSLGGLVTFAATGEPPFGSGSGTDLLFRIVHEQPDLTALRELDAELAAVVESCLAKDPAQRPTAADLVGIAARHAAPGRPQWPLVIAQRIAMRTEFASTTRLSQVDIEGVTTFDPPEAETVPLNVEPVKEEKKPKPERRRKRLVLILPLVLATGTAGSLIATHNVPFVSSAGGSGKGAPTVAVSSAHATGKPTTTAKPTTSPTTHASTAASASTSTSTGSANSSHTSGGGSTGSGGSGSNSGSGGTTSTKTTAKATTVSGGPAAGPSSSESEVSGSEVTVNNCAGWLDFDSPTVFYGIVSAGSASNCGAAFTSSSSVQSTSTQDISASDGGKASANSCGGCWYVGTWTITAKICVWNKDDATDETCSATYTYESTTGKVTKG
ncbi:MAG TPA: serine/threonine-protein kinase [Actinospica sp.]|nr:serine/threonine-protein kinase [Actinospica sp.]